MSKKLTILLMLMFVALTACQNKKEEAAVPEAPPKEEATDYTFDGQKMETEMWEAMKTGDIEKLTSHMTDSFQSLHTDGPRTKEQELELIKNLQLGQYTLTDFVVTQDKACVVVTYKVAVTETIDGKELSKAPAERVSVWYMTEGGWKWIAHANLNPVPAAK